MIYFLWYIIINIDNQQNTNKKIMNTKIQIKTI